MKILGKYPSLRMRRNRKSDWVRRLVSENNLTVNDLIWPIFIREGKNIKEPIKSMPGVYRYSLDKIEKLVESKNNLENSAQEESKNNKLFEISIKFFEDTASDLRTIPDAYA